MRQKSDPPLPAAPLLPQGDRRRLTVGQRTSADRKARCRPSLRHGQDPSFSETRCREYSAPSDGAPPRSPGSAGPKSRPLRARGEVGRTAPAAPRSRRRRIIGAPRVSRAGPSSGRADVLLVRAGSERYIRGFGDLGVRDRVPVRSSNTARGYLAVLHARLPIVSIAARFRCRRVVTRIRFRASPRPASSTGTAGTAHRSTAGAPISERQPDGCCLPSVSVGGVRYSSRVGKVQVPSRISGRGR